MENMIAWMSQHQLLIIGLFLSLSLISAIILNELITSARKLKTLLKNNDRRLQHDSINLYQKIKDIGFYRWDMEHNELVWSDSAFQLFGIDRRKQPTMNFYLEEIVHPEDYQQLVEKLEQAINHRMDFENEHRILKANGQIRYIRETVTIISNLDHTNHTLVGLWQDITYIKMIEATLFKKQHFLQILLDHIPIGVIYTTVDGKTQTANKAFCDLFNITEEQFIDSEFDAALLPEDFYPILLSTDQKALEKKSIDQFTQSLCFKNKTHYLQVTKIPALNKDRQPIGIITLVEELRKPTTAAREHAHAYVQKQDELSSQVLTMFLSHTLFMARRYHYYCALLLIDFYAPKEEEQADRADQAHSLPPLIALRLQQEIGEENLMISLNNHEFGVVIGHLDEQLANAIQKIQEICEKTYISLTQPFNLMDQAISLSISMGICLFPTLSTQKAEEIVKGAETALLKAKNPDQNSIQFYEKDFSKDLAHSIVSMTSKTLS